MEYFEQFRGMVPYLDITPEQWTYIKATYPKEVVVERLADIAMEYPVPMADITEKDAREEYMRLKRVRWNELLTEEEWFPRKSADMTHPLTFDGKHLMFKRYNGGNSASNYFQQYNRWTVSGSVSPGPVKTWNEKKFMVTLMGALYTLKCDRVDRDSLRVCLSLRKYICSQFKPSVAKAIYDYFKAETILDFSMGWGDRLCGFYASEYGKHYIGLDPRVVNHPIYDEQVKFYDKHNGFFEHDRTVEYYAEPAEDFDYSPYTDKVDLIFTSPPYFNVERYSEESTQSWVRYKNIDLWNESFLHKALGKMIPTLKKGGIMAINISDVYASSGKDRGFQSIVTPMIDFLLEKGMHYMGVIGMEMTSRPNSGGAGAATEETQEERNWTDELIETAKENEGKTFGEPIWIFEKI